MGSRRARRANGRTASSSASSQHPKIKPGIHKSGIRSNKQATRAFHKSTRLTAAKAQRKLSGEESPPLLAVFSLGCNCSDTRLETLTSTLQSSYTSKAKKQDDHTSFSSVIIKRWNNDRRRTHREVLISALDAVKVADILLFVFDGEDEIDDIAISIIDALRSQGLPSVFSVAIGEGNDNSDLRKLRSRQLAAESLGEEHVLRPIPMNLATTENEDKDAAMIQKSKSKKALPNQNQSDEEVNRNAIRRLFAKQPHKVTWRSRYGYMLTECIKKEESRDILTIGGWIRGRGFNANELIHITGFGSFKIDSIVDSNTGQTLSKRDENVAEPIESEAPIDETMGEQTWPPEMDEGQSNENNDFEENDVGEQLAKEYDAGFEDEDDGDEEEEDGKMHEEKSEEVTKNIADDGDDDDDDDEVNMDMEDMSVDVDEIRRTREQAKEALEFPDEVDTPLDKPARVRFARYRGLKSLRTGEWDPKEQLPKEYASLFQFRNLVATKKRVFAAAAKDAEEARKEENETDNTTPKKSNLVPSGKKVVIRVKDIPSEIQEELICTFEKGETPIVACGLLRHENRRTVNHFAVRRTDSDSTNDNDGDENGSEDDQEELIKAKTPMEMHCGFMRFTGRPMFSEHNANSDKHKMERYLFKDKMIVASFYGPAVFAPAPALLCKIDGKVVASGNTLGADPDRIVLKRVILTGYPFKTQKKRTVAKFMFFNPEDIRWFKPVELWTKLGRSGHMQEPIGTHGHMKCVFDNVVLHHDTICMTLYKRVYPKLLDTNKEDEV